MKRRLVNFATLLSLLLCVATVVLWAQSYAGSAGWYLLRDQGYSELAWLSGEFYVSHGSSVGASREREQWGRSPGLHGFWDVGSPSRPNLLREARYVTGSTRVAWCPIWDDKGIVASYRIIREPCWAAALAFAVLPALMLLRRIRSGDRRTKGFCRTCGYDLRATPGRCPECGTAAQPSGAA